ncbi:hypothetical protein GF339_19215 [candidate division KSB3 bacterium]|uniref:Uncharacterized protein n=1 Tax=candidate division KSB3 bacterium TaxID=2044937 RepID=A0A9D5JZL8_9BACT|nr:hypothetical protein [candidate division KSB3 bacterium]MBD3326722.1 hypothetical protein [candidate division KSB3 bacterium]
MLPAKKLFWCFALLLTSSFLSLLCVFVPAAEGKTILTDGLSLFTYRDNALTPCWLQDGPFAQELKQDRESFGIPDNTGYLKVPQRLQHLTRKIRLTFSPQVIIKPFVIVREIQDLFVVYQSRKYPENVPVDEDFQVTSLLISQIYDNVQKIIQERTDRVFSICPYYNRIYGLHLEICW